MWSKRKCWLQYIVNETVGKPLKVYKNFFPSPFFASHFCLSLQIFTPHSPPPHSLPCLPLSPHPSCCLFLSQTMQNSKVMCMYIQGTEPWHPFLPGRETFAKHIRRPKPVFTSVVIYDTAGWPSVMSLVTESLSSATRGGNEFLPVSGW